jgi:hypothetical protein
MNDININEQPVRVLRVVPMLPIDPDSSPMAWIDLVHVETGWVFPDCELRGRPDPCVSIPNSSVLLYVPLRGGSVTSSRQPAPLETADLEVFCERTTAALNHFFGIPSNPTSFIDWCLNSPSVIDEWRDRARDVVLGNPDWARNWARLFDSSEHWNSWVLNEFLEGPAWEAWVETHKPLSLREALETFVASDRDNRSSENGHA